MSKTNNNRSVSKKQLGDRSNNYKIGIDLHGVITANPQYFSRFTHEAQKRGFEIHILTGAGSLDAKKELKKADIVYDHLFSILDYYRQKGKVEDLGNGNFRVEDSLWNSAKAKYSNANNIDLHIDDKEEYGNGMNAVFCHYKHSEQKCTVKIAGKTHEFHLSQNMEKTFTLIERILKK